MAGNCGCGGQAPKILNKPTIVKADLIDTEIGTSAAGKTVRAGDCLTTCADLNDALGKVASSLAGNVNHGTSLPADATDDTRGVTMAGITKMLTDKTNNAAQDAVRSVMKSAIDDLLAKISALSGTGAPVHVTDLDVGVNRLGLTPFFGINMSTDWEVSHEVSDTMTTQGGVKVTRPYWTKGYPNENDPIGNAFGKIDVRSKLPADSYWDYAGWQLATPTEVVQVVYHGNQAWQRSNDSGMRANGEIIDTTAWSNWIKVQHQINGGFASVTELNALKARVATLESRLGSGGGR